MLIGSHISLNRNNGYLLGAVRETIANGANTLMVFTGPPHNKSRVPVSSFGLEEARELARAHGIDLSNAVVHAPYIVNLASPNPESRDFNIDHMVLEITRTHEMGMPYIVLHPGYHTDQTPEEGMERLVSNLREVLRRTEHLGVYVCLETMAGKRNQLGSTLEELGRMIEGCGGHRRLAVCLDIVHLHDAGYDVSRKDELLSEVDRIIGLSRVKVLHIGDSKNPRGSRRDVHANFNFGHIGFDVALDWIRDPRFAGVPIIVETPYWILEEGGRRRLVSPYRHEIALLKAGRWEPIPDPRCRPR